MPTHARPWFAGIAFACLVWQLPSCGSSSSSTQDPEAPDASAGGDSGDAAVEASKGGSAGAKGGAGGAAGGNAGGGGKAGAAGKAGAGGADSGAGGGDASAGSGGDEDGGGGTDSSTGDTGIADALVDAPQDAPAEAGPVCALQSGEAQCNSCMLSHCNDSCLKCEGNPFCAAIIACVDVCTDDDCRKKCWDNNKDGQDDFTALASQDGCLDEHCAAECPNLPDTSGCTLVANRPSQAGWLLLATMLGAAGAITRRRRS